jgi:hypothetical protein
MSSMVLTWIAGKPATGRHPMSFRVGQIYLIRKRKVAEAVVVESKNPAG